MACPNPICMFLLSLEVFGIVISLSVDSGASQSMIYYAYINQWVVGVGTWVKAVTVYALHLTWTSNCVTIRRDAGAR